MKQHLSPEQFVDALDGTLAPDGTAHLASCEPCRTELAATRALLEDVRHLDATEPSPLFWDHFSARVKGATSRESRAAGWSWAFGWKPAVAALAAAGALALGLYGRMPSAPRDGAAPTVTDIQAGAESEPVPYLEDDGSLGVVTALAADMDWGELSQAVVPVAGTADAMIEELTAEQREALAKLLEKGIGDL